MPDREEIAALMSAALGRPVVAAEPGFADWVATARPPCDSRQLALLEKVFAHYAAHGQPGNSLVARPSSAASRGRCAPMSRNWRPGAEMS
jgi:hypothetical protein